MIYKLVDQKVFSYEQLGIKPIYGSVLPRHIIEEHLRISAIYQEVNREKKAANNK